MKQQPSLLLFSGLFIISHCKEPNTDPLYLLTLQFRNTAEKTYMVSEINSSDQQLREDASSSDLKTIKILNELTKRPSCLFPNSQET